MYHLATLIPALRRYRLPLSRDQFMLGMAALNEIFLGIDIYLAHSISGTIVPNEWIPIIFGPVAGVLLLIAGLVALRNRPLATIFANLVFIASIVVGLLGGYFHLVRAILPAGPAGQQVSVNLLVWAPPVIGPLVFSLVGLIGLSAAWIEDPPDSGRLLFLGGRSFKLPYSKTRAYFFMVSTGTLATLISSVLDHARTPFTNPWLWVPVGAGVFGVVTAAIMGILQKLNRSDVITYLGAMLLLIAVGVIGMILHINENLTAEGLIVQERFVRGAPFMAPLLFANMGTIGILALLNPATEE
ncbi:MAG: hypothetical protein PVG32_04945 [Anaerolineales bacterium]